MNQEEQKSKRKPKTPNIGRINTGTEELNPDPKWTPIREVSISYHPDLYVMPKESYYVRFHQPVPPGEDKEPVSEFRLKSTQKKYVVDSILWTPNGVVVKAYNETFIVSLANVMYCRLSL